MGVSKWFLHLIIKISGLCELCGWFKNKLIPMYIKVLTVSCVVAFFATMFLMPFMVVLSRRFGIVSDVGERHVGNVPVGRLGGGAVLVGTLLSIGITIAIEPLTKGEIDLFQNKVFGIFGGTLIVAFVGFLDDWRRVSADWKIVVHIGAAIFAYNMGLKIDAVDLPFLKPIRMGFLAFPITLIWIVGVVNAINLIDGLDGLAGGVVFFAAIVNMVAGLSINAFIPALLMSSIAGAILGFLCFNWYPAKIYLGDGGAYSLGFILATSSLLAPFQKAATGVALLVPILAAGLPILDTSVTMLRRALNKRGIFSADRGHLHHLLLDAGISHRRVVVGLYMVSCLMGSMALMIVFRRRLDIGCVLLGASIVGSIIWGVSVRHQLIKLWVRIKKNFPGKH